MHLNCAVDAHGRMAGPGGQPARISTDDDLRRVHGLRAEYDAILVGVHTVLRDDPSLRVKPEFAQGPNPIPVILDTRLRTPKQARIVRAGTRIYHTTGAKKLGQATLVRVGEAPDGVDLVAVLRDLHQAGVQSILVEGGATVLEAFRRAGLWDTWTVFQSGLDLGEGPTLWNDWQAGGTSEEALGGTLWTFSP